MVYWQHCLQQLLFLASFPSFSVLWLSCLFPLPGRLSDLKKCYSWIWAPISSSKVSHLSLKYYQLFWIICRKVSHMHGEHLGLQHLVLSAIRVHWSCLLPVCSLLPHCFLLILSCVTSNPTNWLSGGFLHHKSYCRIGILKWVKCLSRSQTNIFAVKCTVNENSSYSGSSRAGRYWKLFVQPTHLRLSEKLPLTLFGV